MKVIPLVNGILNTMKNIFSPEKKKFDCPSLQSHLIKYSKNYMYKDLEIISISLSHKTILLVFISLLLYVRTHSMFIRSFA